MGIKAFIWENPHGVMVSVLDSNLDVSEFKLWSCYYIHFRTDTLGKGINPLICHRLYSVTAVLQRWL